MSKETDKRLTVLFEMTPLEQAEYIKRAMGYRVLARPPKYWLDTGYEYLNKVMGSKRKGLAYGKFYLIAGKPSSGKSALAAKLAGLAQRDGADVAWTDVENSFDPRHVAKQGLDPESVTLFKPEYGVFAAKKKRKKPGKPGEKEKEQPKKFTLDERVETAEELCSRVETWMKIRRKVNPEGKLCVVLDSTNAISPSEEQEAGLTDQNMRTRTSRATFLNYLLQQWVQLAEHTNALMIFITQLRTNPTAFGRDPDYVSGGNGIIYYPSSMIWMRRVKGGEVKQSGQQIGVMGIISNKKNKVGGGSIEHKRCGYKAYFYKDDWKFMSAEKIEKGIE